MPAPTQCEEFLDAVRESGVIDGKRLDSFLEQRSAGASPPEDARTLAEEMVREGLLTAYQREQLLQGKRRGFVVADKYILLGHIGQGGMGNVFLCEHKVMRRRVALKVLPPSFAKDPEYVDRFQREARAAAALDHPNIVRAHDAGSDGKMHFLVMEYIEGESLHEIVSAGGAIEIQRATDYILQAARGLEHAHEAGFVHRDIKPGNLLVDRKGTLKILDMGLAVFFQERESLTKQYDAFAVLGTADFLAPEQAVDSHGVDIRADIYSLGLTFFFLLTGKNIYGEGTIAQKLLWHQMREVKSVREFRPEVPEGIAAIISKMIAKDRADRYQSPLELIEALTPWVAGAADIAPVPPSAPSVGTAAAADTNGQGVTIKTEPPVKADSTKKAPPPSGARTIKTARVEKPDSGNKRPRPPVKVVKASLDPAPKPASDPRGPKGARPRRDKPRGFWRRDRQIFAAVVCGLLLLGVGTGFLLVWKLKSMTTAIDKSTIGNPAVTQTEAAIKAEQKTAPPRSRRPPLVKLEDPKTPAKGPAQTQVAKTPEPKKETPPAVTPPKPTPPAPPPMPPVKKPPQSLVAYFPTVGTRLYNVGHFNAGLGLNYVQQKWEFRDKGIIDVSIIKGQVASKAPKRERLTYRISDKFVEIGVTIKKEIVFEPVLPLSASEGDSWSHEIPNQGIERFTLLKFDEYKGHPSVAIQSTLLVPNNPLFTQVVTLYTFAKDIGMVSLKMSGEASGKPPTVLLERTLVDQ